MKTLFYFILYSCIEFIVVFKLIYFFQDLASSTDDISRTSFDTNGENGTSVTGPSRRDKRETSSEQEEYTYERAIQNYVNFTESRVRGKSLTPLDSESSKLTNGFSNKSSPPIPTKPRRGSCKIEEKLSELEQIKKKSMSTNDLTENTKRSLSVPKVDILKRREMFEKPLEEETQSVKNRLSGDFGSSKSISERLSSLGKPSENAQSIKKTNRISSEISVKERLSYIEKQKSLDSTPPKSNTLPNDNTAILSSSKQKLTSLKKVSSTEKTQPKSQIQRTPETMEIKAKPLTTTSKVKEKVTINESLSSKKSIIADNNVLSSPKAFTNGPVNGEQKEVEKLADSYEPIEPSLVSTTDEMYETKRQQHYRHRSLDSLDVESNDGVGNESFERVQSLEDLDYSGNYPASSVSGDTDREDSGIHTADVSSSVSQADDCDLHLEGEFHQQPRILEEIRKNHDHTVTTLIPKQVNQISVSDHEVEITDEVVPVTEVVENSSGFLKLPLRLDCDPLPVILESPSEPIPPTAITELLNFDNSIPLSIPNTSSHNVTTSQSNVTNNVEKDSNSVKIEAVHISSSLETQLSSLTLADGGGKNLAANSVPVHKSPHSLSTLPVDLSSAEILHDSNSGSVEICQKIDLRELSTLLSSNSDISVKAEFEKEEVRFTIIMHLLLYLVACMCY